MPSRNTIRLDTERTYYHVYARGASKQRIFYDNDDFSFFISLFKRYLSGEQAFNKVGEPYPVLAKDIELLAFCLMPNHFHLYVYQETQGSLSLLMRGIMTSYSRYFNKKYNRTGSLFESRYKSLPITDDSQRIHISRYIHMNPRYWQRYSYSSLPYYLGKKKCSWLHSDKVMSDFSNSTDYFEFLETYASTKSEIDDTKLELADS